MATETTMKGKAAEKAAMVRRLSPQAAMKPQSGRFRPTYVMRKQARKLAGISTAPLSEKLKSLSQFPICHSGSRTLELDKSLFKWNQVQGHYWSDWNQHMHA